MAFSALSAAPCRACRRTQPAFALLWPGRLGTLIANMRETFRVGLKLFTFGQEVIFEETAPGNAQPSPQFAVRAARSFIRSRQVHRLAHQYPHPPRFHPRRTRSSRSAISPGAARARPPSSKNRPGIAAMPDANALHPSPALSLHSRSRSQWLWRTNPVPRGRGRRPHRVRRQIAAAGFGDGGDEPYMLASNLKDVVVWWTKNRVKSGRYAIEKFGWRHPPASTMLPVFGNYAGRRHDVVLIDCRSRSATEFMQPRGLVREPPSHLARATPYSSRKATERPGTCASASRN